MKSSTKNILFSGLSLLVILAIIVYAIWLQRSEKSQLAIEENYRVYSIDDQYNMYENDSSGISFMYPKNFGAPVAPSNHGDIAEFFLPNSTTENTESLDFDIDRNGLNLDDVIKRLKEEYAKNAPVDVKEITLGGQKGYRVLYTTFVLSDGNMQDLSYITAMDGTLYELRFEIFDNKGILLNKDLPTIENVAKSFKFLPHNTNSPK